MLTQFKRSSTTLVNTEAGSLHLRSPIDRIKSELFLPIASLQQRIHYSLEKAVLYFPQVKLASNLLLGFNELETVQTQWATRTL